MNYDFVSVSSQILLTVPNGFGYNKPVCIITEKTAPSDISDYDVHAKMDTYMFEISTMAIFEF